MIPAPGKRQSVETGIPKCHDSFHRKTKPSSYPPPRPSGGGRFMGRDRRLSGHFRPFVKDERRGRRAEIYAVNEKLAVKGTKTRYCEYHKSRTHDTVSCAVLKREIEEKQLKGNVIEIAKSLRAKFDTKNPKDATRKTKRRLEILTIHHKKGRAKRMESTWSIKEAM